MGLSAKQIKFINALKLKKNRLADNLFIAEGEKVVLELLDSNFKLHSLYTTEKFAGISEPHEIISQKELTRISQLKSPNKCLAIFEIPQSNFNQNVCQNELVLVLDNINDPGNMGTLIRLADWFNVPHIICSKNCVDVYNSKVIQSSMGSISRTAIHYMDLNELFANTPKEVAIYGTVLNGESLYEQPLHQNGFIVMGSESHGISKTILGYINKKITIPKFGQAESLNVATAAAIVLSEFRRD